MLATVITLIRGRQARAEERFLDAHALLILEQQLRDAASEVTAARRGALLAAAEVEAEAARHRDLVARIADLEERTVAALAKGKADLARDAARTIAGLEAERAATEEAQARLGAEVDRLRALVAAAERRLRDVERGQRIAVAADRAQRVREVLPVDGPSALGEAEVTLARLRQRQRLSDLAAAAAEAEGDRSSRRMTERLAEAGCGAPVKESADAVLERLRARVPPAA